MRVTVNPAIGDSVNMTERTVPVSIDPCLAKREPDEPMFILLARDSCAVPTMDFWCNQREREIWDGLRPDTPEEREHIKQVRQKADAFRQWRYQNRVLPMRKS